jgi:hypothetical protein
LENFANNWKKTELLRRKFDLKNTPQITSEIGAWLYLTGIF